MKHPLDSKYPLDLKSSYSFGNIQNVGGPDLSVEKN